MCTYFFNKDTIIQIKTTAEKIFLHFKAGDGVPPFNAECTVVRKSVRSPNHVQYGVQFDKISQSVQKAIHQLSVAPSFAKTGKAA